ncbi:shikimate kinase [Halobacteriales archaeon SW_12_71_31]|nr:MAG: shikimate kinase [Halobacteriales archaeon SW_12_71_31]
MQREGTAAAPAAGTVVNALATGVGSAFALDRVVRARVTLDDSGSVDGEVGAVPTAESATDDVEVDASLVERCVERALDRFGDDADADRGATVRTESEVPVAVGLKSSSAAANAAVMATCDALGVDPEPLSACRVGVAAARDVGVTVTGAFDDASASMLGGVTVTDNAEDELLATDTVDWTVLVRVPAERTYTADVDVDRCRRVAPLADHAADLALDGRYALGMTVNGFAFAPALGASTAPLLAALPDADGVSLSGTGPAVTVVGDPAAIERVRPAVAALGGDVWTTTTRDAGVEVGV